MNPLLLLASTALASTALASEPIELQASISAAALRVTTDWTTVATYPLGSRSLAFQCVVRDRRLHCRAAMGAKTAALEVLDISIEKGTLTLGPLAFKNVEGLDSETEVIEFMDRANLQGLEK